MTNKILNNVDHKDLKIDIQPSERYGDSVNRVAVVATEYSDLHKQFPILIHKNTETGELASHAILGLEKDENLFIENDEWQVQHLPAMLARGPFSIGYQKKEENGEEITDTLIMVDEEHPRCSNEEGEPVFLEFGGESPYLEYMKKVLKTLETGIRVDKMFFGLLEEMDLLEPVSIELTLTSEKKINFNGYYTINQTNLSQLDGDQLTRLNQANILGLIFFLISSVDNFEKMIEMKNAKDQAEN